MSNRIFLSLIFIAVLSKQSHAQEKQGQDRVDSLLSQLPKAAEDTNKVTLLNDLSFTYFPINPDVGLKYGNLGLRLAQKLNWKKGMAAGYRSIAVNYANKSDYPEALKYFLKALQLFEEVGNKNAEARVLGNIGNVYTEQSDYSKALEYFFKTLKMQEELGNKNASAGVLNNIGLVYQDQFDYRKALENYFSALKINEETGNNNWIALNLGNIGNVYSEKKDYTRALEYRLKALKMYEDLGDKNGVAKNLGNIGTTYLIIAKDSIKTELNKLFGGNKTADLLRAKAYTDSAIVIEKEMGSLKELFVNYKQLSGIQVLLGDHQGALESYTSYTTFKDSVFNMEKDKKLTQTAMQYEFDKKEAAIKAAQEKKDIQQRNIRIAMIAGSIVLLLLLIGLIGRYRFKQKANKEIETAYRNLKDAQQQLVKSEKMAAFGMMASRVSHEIQNPLNFVNNFSELSQDLAKEIVSDNSEEAKKEAAISLVANLQKINHHSKRADSIIKQLQEHMRAGTANEFVEGKKE